MRKRILSILLTLCMLLCLVPTSVFAEGEAATGTATIRNIHEELQAMPEALLWFDRDVFDKLIAKIIVSSKTALEFELKCGIRLKEQIEWD